MVNQGEYLEVAKRINQLRECNWMDIATGVAEVLETFNPALDRKRYSKEVVKGTEFEKIMFN